MQRLLALWRDENGGFLNSAELIFLSAILVIGIIPGVSTLRDAILTELCDMADAVDHIAPPFSHPHPGPGPTVTGGEEGSSTPQYTVCSQYLQ